MLVVNEYGELQGTFTLEDILEEIVGQVYDEHYLSNNKIKKKLKDEYIIDGLVPVRDLNRELIWHLPKIDANTR